MPAAPPAALQEWLCPLGGTPDFTVFGAVLGAAPGPPRPVTCWAPPRALSQLGLEALLSGAAGRLGAEGLADKRLPEGVSPR